MSQSAIQQSIHLLFDRQHLTTEQADAAMTEIMNGDATPAQIGAFLAALRMKGETIEEITGCASAMKRSTLQVRPNIGDSMLVDVVGTGGDVSHTFNISTTAAFVVAGHGVKVAKHGNRSVSSRSGAADVLLALGANIHLTAEQSAECIEEIGFTFLFAATYHPAMKFAIGPRARAIGAHDLQYSWPIDQSGQCDQSACGGLYAYAHGTDGAGVGANRRTRRLCGPRRRWVG